LTEKTPYNCVVEVKPVSAGQGWAMKDPEPWLKDVFAHCASDFFDGNAIRSQGCGGAIPFLAELGKQFPSTGIYATGVGG